MCFICFLILAIGSLVYIGACVHACVLTRPVNAISHDMQIRIRRGFGYHAF